MICEETVIKLAKRQKLKTNKDYIVYRCTSGNLNLTSIDKYKEGFGEVVFNTKTKSKCY